MPAQNIQNPDALLLYKVGPVFVCSPTLLVEVVLLPPQFSVPPGANAAEPGIFRSINGMVRVVDLRVRFGVEQSDFNEPGRIIIAQLAGTRIGFWVDKIEDVVGFPQTGWKGVPVYIPREVFSRTLLRDNCIILYADFERLDKFKTSGYLRKHIAQLNASEKKQTDNLSQRQHVLNEPIENKPAKNKSLESKANESKTSESKASESKAGGAGAKTLAQQHEPPSTALAKHPGRIKEAPGLSADSGKRVLVKTNKLSTHKIPQAVHKNRDKKAVSESSVIRPAGANKSKISGGVVNRKASGQTTTRLNAGYEQGAREGVEKYKFNKNTTQDIGKVSESSVAKNNISSSQAASRFTFIWAALSLLVLALPVYLWVRPFDVEKWDVPKWDVAESGVQEEGKNTASSKILTEKYLEKIPDEILEKSPEAVVEKISMVMPEVIAGVIAEEIPEETTEETTKEILDKGFFQAEMEVQVKGKPDLSDDRLEQDKGKETGAMETQNVTPKALAIPPSVDYSEPETLILPGEPGQVKLIEGSEGIIVIINEVRELEPDKESGLIAGDLSGRAEKERATIDGRIEKTLIAQSLLKKHPEKVVEVEAESSEVAAEAEKLAPEPELKSTESVMLKREKAASKKLKTRTYIHIIVKGDTLWDIARRYVNDPWRYPELASLNKIKNPDLIYPGNKVIVIIRSHNR